MTDQSQRFAGKTVAITGAAHGIGAATALRFLTEGARVAVIDREAEGRRESGDQPAGRLLAVAGDCTVPRRWPISHHTVATFRSTCCSTMSAKGASAPLLP